MIYRIVGSYLIFCLFLAVSLSLAGVSSTTQLGSYFQSAMVVVSRRMSYTDFTIPKVPTIPSEFVQSSTTLELPYIIEELVRIGRYLMNIVNIIVTLFNGIIWLINIIIKLFTFITILLETLDQMSIDIKNASQNTSALILLRSW